MSKHFFILSDDKVQNALDEFRTKEINGDDFFGRYGPGNTFPSANRPFERFADYQLLLEKMEAIDKEKFARTHKGTAFFFLFWTAYDCGFYEKALFYLDAAISENVLIAPHSWHKRQSAKYLWLNEAPDKAAGRAVEHTKGLLKEQLDRFNSIAGVKTVTLDDFIEKFVRKLVMKTANGRAEGRTIVTALYTYLAEAEQRYKELKLRSRGGGSTELPLKHLFKGGLIFESLLKECYPALQNGMLGTIFKDPNFRNDFPGEISTKATKLETIRLITSPDDRLTAFNVTSQLRNTTGHNLVWDDVFSNPDNFRRFVEQQVNAILYIAGAKFL